MIIYLDVGPFGRGNNGRLRAKCKTCDNMKYVERFYQKPDEGLGLK